MARFEQEVAPIIKLFAIYGVPDEQKNSTVEAKEEALVYNKTLVHDDGDRFEPIKHSDYTESELRHLPFGLTESIKEGTLVQSKRLGIGTIVKIDPVLKHIVVNFGTGEKKIFVVPDCFDKGFLTVLTSTGVNPQDITVDKTQTLKEEKSLSLAEFFENAGFEVVDKRNYGGALWVIGTQSELKEIVNEAKRIFGAYGRYSDGGRSVGYRKSWFTSCDK